jgi:hypothetical protein
VKDKADGYTLILVTSTTQAINPHLYQKPGLDMAKRSASWHALPPGRFSRS